LLGGSKPLGGEQHDLAYIDPTEVIRKRFLRSNVSPILSNAKKMRVFYQLNFYEGSRGFWTSKGTRGRLSLTIIDDKERDISQRCSSVAEIWIKIMSTKKNKKIVYGQRSRKIKRLSMDKGQACMIEVRM
jgi:hypothetical protein